jgi:hypothetical protein
MQNNYFSKKSKVIIPLLLFMFFLFSCKTVESGLGSDLLVLEALFPPPPVAVEEVVEKPLPVVPLYVQGRVMEIEVVQGVQSFLYVKFNDEILVGKIPEVDKDITEKDLINLPDSFQLEENMRGEIFSDTQFIEKAGDILLMEKYSDIFKVKIESLNYIIDRSSVVRVQIR